MKSKKIIGILAMAVLVIAIITGIFMTSGKNKVSRPKLVVGIVVDQMRWDYLYRYYDRYGSNGFKRLLNDGFSCENTMLNYVPSFTAVGHSCIYTGSVPSITGIPGNDFIDQATGRSTYCTEDTTVYSVDTYDKLYSKGQMSPANLKVSTITDELKLATNFRSKVIGISIKDRASILPAGHAADAAYWFDGNLGKFITSTWYEDKLPQWLKDFNDRKLPEQYLSQDWNPLYPIDTYKQSVSDKNNYEEPNGSYGSQFPIKTSEIMKTDGLGIISATPYGNTLMFDLAKATIENEKMGKHDDTDFLALSLSAPDYVGHQYTVNSPKVEDTYLRLDKKLGEFFDYLDAKVGKGNYVVFLTADHGASHNAQFLTDHKIPAGIFDNDGTLTNLNEYLAGKFGVKDLVLSLQNYQVNFNYRNITPAIDKNKLIEECIDYLQKLPNVEYAVQTSKVAEACIPSVIKEKIINGYYPRRCGEIQIIPMPAVYDDNNKKGGTHGTWNPYDAHIPLLWMGWGIKHGKSNKEVYMTDIAPTLAALLHIQMPNGCIGKPILPVLAQ